MRGHPQGNCYKVYRLGKSYYSRRCGGADNLGTTLPTALWEVGYESKQWLEGWLNNYVTQENGKPHVKVVSTCLEGAPNKWNKTKWNYSVRLTKFRKDKVGVYYRAWCLFIYDSFFLETHQSPLVDFFNRGQIIYYYKIK